MTMVFGETVAMVVGNEAIARQAGFTLRYLHQLKARGLGPPVDRLKVGKLTCLAITEEALAAWKADRAIEVAKVRNRKVAEASAAAA